MRFAPFLVVVALVSPVRLESGDQAHDAVLDRFLGQWKTEALIRNYGPPVRESRTSGQAVCRRTRGGRDVEFRTSSIDPPGLSEVQIMTYDRGADAYRQQVSDSDGYRHEALGRWNATTSTLTWHGHVDGVRFVIDDRWVSRDRLVWTLTRTAADGRLLQRIEGVVSR